MTKPLTKKIQQFYDESSLLWERNWGEHMHHGYYGSTGQQKKNRRQAQIDLIEELLSWGKVSEGPNHFRCGLRDWRQYAVSGREV